MKGRNTLHILNLTLKGIDTNKFSKWLSERTANGGKNPSSTKKGPGRFHKSGYSLGSKRHRKMAKQASLGRLLTAI